MNSTFCIVFKGELLSGRPLTEVKRRVELLFKLPPQKVDTIFCGATVVLRKGLATEEAEHYLTAFNNAGMHVYVVREDGPVIARNEMRIPASFPIGIDGDKTQAVEVNVKVGALLSLAPNQVQCPVCGSKQPRRTLCLSCGLDMPRYLASQKEDIEREREEKRYKQKQKRYAKKGRLRGIDLEDAPFLFGFDFSGRVGRKTYLIMLLVQFCLLIMANALLLKAFFSSAQQWVIEENPLSAAPSSSMFIGLILLMSVLGLGWWIRAMVLRSHDIGWTGKPAVFFGLWPLYAIVLKVLSGLLGFVISAVTYYFFFAFVVVFSLALLFMPGSDTSNQYGDLPSPRGWFWIAMSLGLVIVVSIFANLLVRSAADKLVNAWTVQHQ